MDNLVTVVLPVHNGEQFLADAVKSIIGQTLLSFECIVVDDGSTDKSIEILKELCDERFLVLRLDSQVGPAKALNLGVMRANTDLVARMDQDDIMNPNRLAYQVAFMEQNPFVAVSGTYFEYIDDKGAKIGDAIKLPVQPDEVREAFKTFTAIGHPTAIFRKKILVDNTNLYSDKYLHAEDIGLWLECLSKGMLFANYPGVMLKYRRHKTQVGNKFSDIQKRSTELAYQDFSRLIWGDDGNM